MKRLAILVTLAIILLGLLVFVSSDATISIADTSVPDNQVTSSVSKASNSSASAGIVITMTGVVDEQLIQVGLVILTSMGQNEDSSRYLDNSWRVVDFGRSGDVLPFYTQRPE